MSDHIVNTPISHIHEDFFHKEVVSKRNANIFLRINASIAFQNNIVLSLYFQFRRKIKRSNFDHMKNNTPES